MNLQTLEQLHQRLSSVDAEVAAKYREIRRLKEKHE